MSEEVSSLELLRDDFGWPAADEIFSPTGAAPAMYARLAQEKIGAALSRFAGHRVDVGVLVPDSTTSDTDVPLAVICSFPSRAHPDALNEAHRLAWNFCHAPVLITIDPYEIRTWSCFVAPEGVLGRYDASKAELSTRLSLNEVDPNTPSQSALHWLRLVAGQLISKNEEKFQPEGRADRLLLDNLKTVRRQLISGSNPLSVDLAHDLIARLMFLQFLFDRKDRTGISAINMDRLSDLHKSGVLANSHVGLADILADYEDTYRFFGWLNDRFNGDFWPAKSKDLKQRAEEWDAEKRQVRPHHLQLLSDLVSGRLEVESGQLTFWRLYSFDTIPLEFVSSIYEEFVSAPPEKNQKPQTSRTRGRKKVRQRQPGVHYTPTHLVDFVLDAVLPWDGVEWRLRVLDPACGSGIFLVRSFQRLVNRWRNAHPGKQIEPEVLRELLESCLLGVEVNPHAARVASFSLYLAMCDEIDPRRYWTEAHFPQLRHSRIIIDDFFRDQTGLIAAAGPFDLVVGNAPWGNSTMTESAVQWAGDRWPVLNKDVGSLFLGKSLELMRDGARLAMIQSAGNLLMNEGSAAVRRKLFSAAKVDEIVNFTILRRQLFPSAESPACSIVLTKTVPDNRPVAYIVPKLLHTGEDSFRIAIDDMDINPILAHEVGEIDPWIVLLTGSRRDLELIRSLKRNPLSLQDFLETGDVIGREGIIPRDDYPVHTGLKQRLVLFDTDFPEGTDHILDAAKLPRKTEIKSHRRTDPRAFELPQLIIKQAWNVETQRFRAALVSGEAVVPSQSYISVHATSSVGEHAIRAACLAYNGPVTRYILTMSNPRMSYRSEMRVKDIYALPLTEKLLTLENDALRSDLDVAALYSLREPELALVEDALKFGVPELLGHRDVGGRKPTSQNQGDDEDDLVQYADYYLKVFGDTPARRRLSATVYKDETGKLPVRMLAIHFGQAEDDRISSAYLGNPMLERFLADLGRAMEPERGKFAVTRVATIFDIVTKAETGKRVPTVFLIRPDQKRFWTRSAAMRDADKMIAQGVLTQQFTSVAT